MKKSACYPDYAFIRAFNPKLKMIEIIRLIPYNAPSGGIL